MSLGEKWQWRNSILASEEISLQIPLVEICMIGFIWRSRKIEKYDETSNIIFFFSSIFIITILINYFYLFYFFIFILLYSIFFFLFKYTSLFDINRWVEFIYCASMNRNIYWKILTGRWGNLFPLCAKNNKSISYIVHCEMYIGCRAKLLKRKDTIWQLNYEKMNMRKNK